MYEPPPVPHHGYNQPPVAHGEVSPSDRERYFAVLGEALSAMPGISITHLPNFQPSHPYGGSMNPNPYRFISPPSRPLAEAESPSRDVRQSLQAVIEAGGEMFAVTVLGKRYDRDDEPGSYGWSEKSALVRLGAPGAASEVVGVIPLWSEDQPLEVGRTADNGYSGSTSGKHFSISGGMAAGEFRVTDLRSTNGTDVVTLPYAAEGSPAKPGGFAALGWLAHRRSAANAPENNPLVDHGGIWQLDAATITDIIEERGSWALPQAAQAGPVESAL